MMHGAITKRVWREPTDRPPATLAAYRWPPSRSRALFAGLRLSHGRPCVITDQNTGEARSGRTFSSPCSAPRAAAARRASLHHRGSEFGARIDRPRVRTSAPLAVTLRAVGTGPGTFDPSCVPGLKRLLRGMSDVLDKKRRKIFDGRACLAAGGVVPTPATGRPGGIGARSNPRPALGRKGSYPAPARLRKADLPLANVRAGRLQHRIIRRTPGHG
jgi:hypothetical protein